MRALLMSLVMAFALGGCAPSANGDEPLRTIPSPAFDLRAEANAPLQTAVLAGGCFWGVEGVYEHVRGVVRVRSGYSGGSAGDANYAAVSSDRTQHAEAVEIVFDPREISYGQLLRIFFSVVHDPTTLNRQGPDVGPQYRSHIFVTGTEQERVARAYIAQLEAADAFPSPIVTRVDALARFYPAEAYHQDFMARNPNHGYIVAHDRPKLEALRRLFPAVYRDDRVS